MGYPVSTIQSIGLLETLDDAIDAGWTIDWQRRRIGPSRPTLQQQLSQSVDVVGVEMRQKDGRDIGGRQVHQGQVLLSSGADIDDQQASPRQDRRARAGARRVGHRRARPAEANVKAITKTLIGIGRKGVLVEAPMAA